ncbi:MAG TPA: hypothetical protein VFZ83_07120, partial [Acidimicrobiia bacterium]|nr:hypothetical protein [Acidimicrobiia bacterium]
FRRRPTGEPEALWVVRPDGTDARRVVAEIHDGPLAWTPDGRITFVDTVADGARRLFTIALDGSDRRLLVDGESAEHAGAVWSPDGDRVVFTDDPDGQLLWDQDLLTGTTTTVGGRAPGRLVFADASGHVLRTLTEPAEGDHDGSPSWSRPL